MAAHLEELQVARRAALGVVAGGVEALGRVLEAGDREDDLHLAEERQRVPCVEGAHRAQLLEGDAVRRREGPREMDTVDVEEEADGGSHRDAAVLDLGVPEELERALAAHRGLRRKEARHAWAKASAGGSEHAEERGAHSHHATAQQQSRAGKSARARAHAAINAATCACSDVRVQ